MVSVVLLVTLVTLVRVGRVVRLVMVVRLVSSVKVVRVVDWTGDIMSVTKCVKVAGFCCIIIRNIVPKFKKKGRVATRNRAKHE